MSLDEALLLVAGLAGLGLIGWLRERFFPNRDEGGDGGSDDGGDAGGGGGDGD